MLGLLELVPWWCRVATVAFEGVEARPVDVQVQISRGNVVFNLVGLGDKAVARIAGARARGARSPRASRLPAKRITVNLAPADMPKEGSHYDLPIALGVMAAIGAIPSDALDGFAVLGELALDGTLDAGRRRAAGGRRRQCARAGADLPAANAGRKPPGPRATWRCSRRAR